MGQAAWPVNSDVQARLTASGLTTTVNTARLDIMIAAAVGWWERETGYLPFKAATQTRTYDPPGSVSGAYAATKGGGKVLRLDCGIVSLTSLSISTVTKTINSDFWLKPANANDAGKPYEWIEFLGPVYGLPDAISIVGSWGYASTIPELAWQSVLDLAAGAYAVPELAQALAGGALSAKLGDEAISYPEMRSAGRELLMVLDTAKTAATLFKRTVSWG